MLTITLSICLVHECIVSQDRQSCEEKRFWYHPRCKSLSLTHSCFSNDLIVFVEGSKQSIEGALSVFEEFSVWSYWRSVWRNQQFTWLVFLKKWSSILTYFPFAEGDLPVKYLGLPLLTKGMKKKDYLPLTEKIRARITTWTSCYISYAGRLQLIHSVLMSIFNLWVSAFPLPGQCLKEVEQLCSAFLWTWPDLKTTSAKFAWLDVCKLKSEGGMGLWPWKEVNTVYDLKLIWRMLVKKSLWGTWIFKNLLKKQSLWEVKSTSQVGSWMWKKMLKLKNISKYFHKKEVGNGKNTLF